MVIENLNIQLPKLKYSYFNHPEAMDELQRLKEEREKHLLNKDQLREKIANGEAVLLNDRDAKHRVFMYIDKTNPLCFMQIYNENGELQFTFPWNGDKQKWRDKLDLTVLDFNESYDTTIKSMEVVATNEGKLAIKTTSNMLMSVCVVDDYDSITLLDRNGKVKSGPCLFDKKNLPFKDIYDKEGNVDVMNAVKNHGDKFFDRYTDPSISFVI